MQQTNSTALTQLLPTTIELDRGKLAGGVGGIAGSGEFENRASTLYREVFWLVADTLNG